MQGIKPTLPLSIRECLSSIVWFIIFRDLLNSFVCLHLVWCVHPDPYRYFSGHHFLGDQRIAVKLGCSGSLNAFHLLVSLSLGAYFVLKVLEMFFGDSLHN